MAAYSYEYKVPGLVKAPAQAVGELFERLEQTEEGLTPATVLEASRDENALLHGEFEWQDDVAAEKYRLDQARFIIRNLTVITKTTDQEERENGKDRAFVVTPDRNSRYVAITHAMSNEKWKAFLLEQAKRDMEDFTRKYRRLSELALVISAIDETKQAV